MDVETPAEEVCQTVSTVKAPNRIKEVAEIKMKPRLKDGCGPSDGASCKESEW